MTRTANAAKNIASRICKILKAKPTNEQWQQMVDEIQLGILGEDNFNDRIKPQEKSKGSGVHAKDH